MPYELPPDPRTERRARITRWVSLAFAAILVGLIGYFGYVGYEGSRQLADAPSPTADCRTPASLGWTYEAINYDIAGDFVLAGETDPTACDVVGPAPGTELTGPGGIRLAGWYVPAASDAGPTGPTVVLVHGWGSNKSNMLDRALLLHDAYNLVFVDLRNHGQSQRSATTQGVREAGDLRAVVDWLETAKGPERIALFGVSMGGATALNEADADGRIDALVIESTHATLAGAAQARLEREGYPLAMPGSWAILLGSLLRTGEDVTAADPIGSVGRLDGQPVLFVAGGADDTMPASDPDDLLTEALAAESPAELHVCPAAGHAEANESCAEDYRGWVLGFLERVLAPSG